MKLSFVMYGLACPLEFGLLYLPYIPLLAAWMASWFSQELFRLSAFTFVRLSKSCCMGALGCSSLPPSPTRFLELSSDIRSHMRLTRSSPSLLTWPSLL